MSLLRKYLKGWQFRSTTPDFEPGTEYRVVITDYAGGTAIARIGDSKLHIDDTDSSHVDTVARVRITEFDTSAHVGRAELVEVIGETTY